MKNVFPLAILFSKTTAHLRFGPRVAPAQAVNDVPPCPLVVEFGASMTTSSENSGDFGRLIAEFTMARSTHKLCKACTTYFIAVRAAYEADAFAHTAKEMLAAATTVTRDHVSDLYLFDDDDILSRAVDAVQGLLDGFSSSADDDFYVTLSRAMYGNSGARAAFASHVDTMKDIMRKALRDAGYDV